MRLDFDLTGKKILLTGASAGIGYATAKCLDDLGATLVLVARREDKLKALISELNPKQEHQYLTYDLQHCSDLPGWMQENLTDLDGLVHCAGVHDTKPLRYVEEPDVDKMLQVNLKAAFALIKGFGHGSVASNSNDRRVVLLSSVLASHGAPGVSAYAASKGAIISVTKSLAYELASKNIRVNCVAPGVVETEMAEQSFAGMIPAQVEAIRAKHLFGLGKPRDVANAIAYLLAPASSWVTGTCLSVDGGYGA